MPIKSRKQDLTTGFYVALSKQITQAVKIISKAIQDRWQSRTIEQPSVLKCWLMDGDIYWLFVGFLKDPGQNRNLGFKGTPSPFKSPSAPVESHSAVSAFVQSLLQH